MIIDNQTVKETEMENTEISKAIEIRIIENPVLENNLIDLRYVTSATKADALCRKFSESFGNKKVRWNWLGSPEGHYVIFK